MVQILTGAVRDAEPDGRMVLTRAVREQLMRAMREAQDCSAAMIGGEPSFAPPTDTVPFTSAAMGFSARLPYNPAWGTPVYAVPAFEEMSLEDGVWRWVSFGPAGIGEGCGIGQTWAISLRDSASAEALVQQADAELASIFREQPIPESHRARIVTIGGHTVVRFISEGFCTRPVLQVVGPRHVYEIAPSCGEGSEEEIAMMERIVESMTFP